nr:PREDICTED: transmembrane protein C9orf91 homolog isoform X1 [Bemisia tabaci]
MSINEDPLNVSNSSKPKKWVQFEDEEIKSRKEEDEPDDSRNGTVATAEVVERITSESQNNHRSESNYGGGAVLKTESVHINLNQRPVMDSGPGTPSTAVNMRTIDLNQTPVGASATSNPSAAILRQGFANGDIIVTLLPVNSKFPWVTPAKFRPELVPEELMAQGLTLTVEDYVQIMALLTNDFRFVVYNICYKRVLVVWIFTAFFILLALLFSGIQGLMLFGLGVLWLIINASAIFLCMWIKIKLNHNLEKCLAHVNRHLIKHKIILGLDDRGKMSCLKVNLCFVYFDTSDCIKKLQEVIEKEEAEGRQVTQGAAPDAQKMKKLKERMDIEDDDIVIQGSTTSYVSRKQERAVMLFLRYASRWTKLHARGRLVLNIDAGRGGHSHPPRHCISSQCPCQFIEEHLKFKPRGNFFSWYPVLDGSSGVPADLVQSSLYNQYCSSY